MLKRLQFWILCTLGAACLLAVGVNMALASADQGLRLRVAQRAQLIEQGATVAGLYRQMVQALAQLSVRNHDPRLQAVLARQGLQVRVQPAVAGPLGGRAAAPAPAGAGGHRGAHHE
jgi:hypothetical protein